MLVLARVIVSKLFRAYGLYNEILISLLYISLWFQSSFELTGYITENEEGDGEEEEEFQSSFELTGYITYALWKVHEY